tara:strand:- start:53 stop:703 length:651 start_codon:yes stop_codon:yes gene_type:complete
MEKFNVYSFFQTLSVAEDAEYKTFDDWFTKFFKSNLDNLTEPELAYVYASIMGLLPYIAGDQDDDRGDELIEKALSLISKNAIKRDLVLGKYIKEADIDTTADYCRQLNPQVQKEDDYWEQLGEKNNNNKNSISRISTHISFTGDGLKFFIYFVLPAFMIIAVIMFLIFAPNPYENCEEVTWYEYGEKKTGVICDDDAKAQMESIREEKGVYKKKE